MAFPVFYFYLPAYSFFSYSYLLPLCFLFAFCLPCIRVMYAFVVQWYGLGPCCGRGQNKAFFCTAATLTFLLAFSYFLFFLILFHLLLKTVFLSLVVFVVTIHFLSRYFPSCLMAANLFTCFSLYFFPSLACLPAFFLMGAN